MSAILVALAVFGCLDEAASQRQVRIAVIVREGDPLGSRIDGTVKHLTESTVVTKHGHPAFFRAGNADNKIANRDAQACASVHLEVVSTLFADGRLYLDMSITRVRVTPGQANGPAGTESTMRVTCVPDQGKPFRFRIAADSPEMQTWAEVTVTAVKP